VNIRVAHLYPELLNIYADRGNIAVLAARAAARGHTIDVHPITLGDSIDPAAYDLYYLGGGQDREQQIVAPDLTRHAATLRSAFDDGAVFLAVCGGYQLLGRGYRDTSGAELPGAGLLPVETVAGERRLIGDVLLTCDWAGGNTLAGFENHAGRTLLDAGALALGTVVAGYGNDGESGAEGCRSGRAYGTYLHGPLLPRNPWFADVLLSEALEHVSGRVVELAPLDDTLERAAHDVAAARARSRGGR
jgi:hypothetical protein